MDVTDLVVGFEAHNHVKLKFCFELVGEGHTPGLVLYADAYEWEPLNGVRRHLALVSVICSAMNLKSWNAVLTHAMYALDFQLALKEFDSTEPPKA